MQCPKKVVGRSLWKYPAPGFLETTIDKALVVPSLKGSTSTKQLSNKKSAILCPPCPKMQFYVYHAPRLLHIDYYRPSAGCAFFGGRGLQFPMPTKVVGYNCIDLRSGSGIVFRHVHATGNINAEYSKTSCP